MDEIKVLFEEDKKLDHKFAYYYKRQNAARWTAIGEKFTETAAAGFKPRSAGMYLIRIITMDETGEKAVSDFGLEVKEPAGSEFVNTSSVSAETITAGSSVTVTGSSNGGAAPVSYTYYYKKAASKVWNNMTSADGASASVKLRNAGTYEIKSVAADSEGKTAEIIITVTVK